MRKTIAIVVVVAALAVAAGVPFVTRAEGDSPNPTLSVAPAGSQPYAGSYGSVPGVLVTPGLVAASASGIDPGILPPQSRAYGKSLTQWLEAYWRWYATEGGPVPYQPGPAPVVFLPLPAGEQTGGSWTPEDPAYLEGELEVTLKAGTAFVLPMFAWIAERYECYPGCPDDPMAPNDLIQSMVTNLAGDGPPEVTLDGRPILQNFWNYYVGPKEFDPIVVYPEPSAYGSIAAVAFQGVGFVSTPLTPGTHTITLLEKLVFQGVPGISPFGLIYDNSWTITVVP